MNHNIGATQLQSPVFESHLFTFFDEGWGSSNQYSHEERKIHLPAAEPQKGATHQAEEDILSSVSGGNKVTLFWTWSRFSTRAITMPMRKRTTPRLHRDRHSCGFSKQNTRHRSLGIQSSSEMLCVCPFWVICTNTVYITLQCMRYGNMYFFCCSISFCVKCICKSSLIGESTLDREICFIFHNKPVISMAFQNPWWSCTCSIWLWNVPCMLTCLKSHQYH